MELRRCTVEWKTSNIDISILGSFSIVFNQVKRNALIAFCTNIFSKGKSHTNADLLSFIVILKKKSPPRATLDTRFIAERSSMPQPW